MRGGDFQHLLKIGHRFFVILVGILGIAQPKQSRRRVTALTIPLHKLIQGHLCRGKIAFAENVHGRFVVAFFSRFGQKFPPIHADFDRLKLAQTLIDTCRHILLTLLNIGHIARQIFVRTTALRIPGIYANDREGGTPRERLQRGTPVLRPEDDVFTNHIHADDLARACVLALWRGLPQRNVNVSDDTDLKMGDYFDLAADLYGLPRPPRIARNAAGDQLPLMLLSFMSESRRLHNQRMKTELGLRLRYPTVAEGLRA